MKQARKLLHDMNTPLATATLLIDALMAERLSGPREKAERFPEQELKKIRETLQRVADLSSCLMDELSPPEAKE